MSDKPNDPNPGVTINVGLKLTVTHPSNNITRENVFDVFSYHEPTSEQLVRYEELREAARNFASMILQHAPPCADRSAAIRHVREALMTANAAIALEPKV